MPCLSRITVLVGSASERDIGPTPWPALAVATIIVIGLGFVWTFAIFTSTSWISFPKFVVATVFLFALPFLDRGTAVIESDGTRRYAGTSNGAVHCGRRALRNIQSRKVHGAPDKATLCGSLWMRAKPRG